MTELKDTVNGMLSEDYKERYKAEYYQLAIRYEKLKKMLRKWDMNELDFTPSCEKWVLRAQLETMEDYKGILEHRAISEGIKL